MVTANLGVTFFSPFPVAVLERKLTPNWCRFTCEKVKKKLFLTGVQRPPPIEVSNWLNKVAAP